CSSVFFRDFVTISVMCSWYSMTDLGAVFVLFIFRPRYWTYQPDFESLIYPMMSRVPLRSKS
ncbi:MAG: hypothetical protein AB7O96_09770, partial [Pseudobdellovibrionaceae bacterium]